MLNISIIKNAPKDLTKDIEDNFYELIVMSYLLGILHVKENLEKQKNFADNDMIPTEAIEWMMSRASVSKEDFYNNIDPKARYKAFTISKLTSLDAIERTKELLSKTLEEGETMKEWRDRLKSDEILSKIGFHENNPFYLETVFRTNTISAYNAGRWAEIQRRKDSIAFLEYVAIDDSRTTEICSALDGTILPADDPFWKTHYPPNHFNCRSQVVEISPEEVEILGYKETDKDKIDEISGVPIPKGFDAPISDSWWDTTESMDERAKKYGVLEGFKDKKKDLLKDIKNYDISKNMEENLLSPIKTAKTIKEAESIANKMGVDVVYNNLKVSNYVNEALELIKNKKDILPEKVVFDVNVFKKEFGEKYFIFPAAFHKEDNFIYINKEAYLYDNIIKEMSRLKINKRFSTKEKQHFFIHEYSHFKWFNRNKEVYLKLEKETFNNLTKETIEKNLSIYGSENKIEFIAEVDVLLFFNYFVDKKIKDLYISIIERF